MTDTSGSSFQLAYQRLLALERFKSGFLARTSHELRSPINTIVSLHQLILEDLCESSEEEKEFIAQSKDAALKMLALFDQITAVSKLDIGREPARLEAVDLSFLLPEVEMLTTLQAANQNVRYTVAAPTDELAVTTDAKWLKNILASLIQDVIAYTKMLRLAVEKSEDAIAIVVECDRAATELQTELDRIADAAVSLPAADPVTDSILPIESIQLSTGLILAMAHTALPLIGGVFTISPYPNSDDRSCLRCEFPR
ncbi:MAG: histidine kinase dimerization/phospho-acceptor domain-containing protein [Phormidesmis sp.]